MRHGASSWDTAVVLAAIAVGYAPRRATAFAPVFHTRAGKSARMSMVTQVEEMTKTHSTSVALVPPEELWEQIQRARYEAKDRGLFRWPPHINLLYPFVEEEHWEAVVGPLAEAVAGVRPFSLRLTGFEIFARKRSATLWLKPEVVEDAAQPSLSQGLQRLQSALQSALPLCDDQRSRHDGTFTPHLSVAHFDSAEEAEEARVPLSLWWEPITWQVEEVHVIARAGYKDQPYSGSSPRIPTLERQFQVKYRVPLGGKPGVGTAGPAADRGDSVGPPLALPLPARENRPYVGMPREPLPYMIPRAGDHIHAVRSRGRRKSGDSSRRPSSSGVRDTVGGSAGESDAMATQKP